MNMMYMYEKYEHIRMQLEYIHKVQIYSSIGRGYIY